MLDPFRVSSASRLAMATVLSLTLLPVPPVRALEPVPVVVMTERQARRFEHRGGTIATGVFAGIAGLYGGAALGASFVLLHDEVHSRRSPFSDPVGCASCALIPISAAISLASSWMFVRVVRRTRAYRANREGVLLVPVVSADPRRGGMQLTLSVTF